MNEYGETVRQLRNDDRKALISIFFDNFEKIGETVERYLGLVEEGEREEGGEGGGEREREREKNLERMVASLRGGFSSVEKLS